MITVTVKTKSGAVTDLQFEEIVSIDGQPYVRQVSDMEFRNLVASLIARVEALEATARELSNTIEGGV